MWVLLRTGRRERGRWFVVNATPATLEAPRFTFDEWSRILGDPIADKAYLEFQLGDVVGQYLSWKEHEDGKSSATIRGYEAALAALCVQIHKSADQVTVNDLRAVRDTFIVGRHHTVTAAFRDCFRWLYEEGITDSNPAGRLRYPKAQKKPITDLFSDEEKAAIVTAQTDVMDRVGVLLFFRAGLRKAELRNVRVRDVNLVEKYVLVTRGKGGKFRTVPIRGAVVRALDELFLTDLPGHGRPRLPDEYLLAGWTSPHKRLKRAEKPVSARWTHHWWYECLHRAGLVPEGIERGRRMHASRHTYATDLGRATNWNMLAVSKNLGHSSIRITIDTYTQFALEDQAAAVEMLPDIEEVET